MGMAKAESDGEINAVLAKSAPDHKGVESRGSRVQGMDLHLVLLTSRFKLPLTFDRR
jgi:hypothetical protein